MALYPENEDKILPDERQLEIEWRMADLRFFIGMIYGAHYSHD